MTKILGFLIALAAVAIFVNLCASITSVGFIFLFKAVIGIAKFISCVLLLALAFALWEV